MANADKVPNMPPPKEPFPGSLTPGWNDPPPLSPSSSSTSTTARPRINLKQRVAFPLEGLPNASATNNSSSNTNLAGGKPVAKVPPQCAAPPVQQPAPSSVLPPLPPLPPKADASSWPVATVHPRQK